MPRDPVCGVILNEKTAKYKITHDGEKYYFCSVKCKKKFKRNRSKFADEQIFLIHTNAFSYMKIFSPLFFETQKVL